MPSAAMGGWFRCNLSTKPKLGHLPKRSRGRSKRRHSDKLAYGGFRTTFSSPCIVNLDTFHASTSTEDPSWGGSSSDPSRLIRGSRVALGRSLIGLLGAAYGHKPIKRSFD